MEELPPSLRCRGVAVGGVAGIRPSGGLPCAQRTAPIARTSCDPEAPDQNTPEAFCVAALEENQAEAPVE